MYKLICIGPIFIFNGAFFFGTILNKWAYFAMDIHDA